MSARFTGGWWTGTMILRHLSSSPEIIWVLATHRKLHLSTGSLGCLSRGSHLAPESDYLLGSKKRKMSQRIQCVVNNRERHADCMRLKTQISAIVSRMGQTLRARNEGTLSQTLRLPAKGYATCPSALPGKIGRQAFGGQADRQRAKQSRQSAAVTSCALGQS